MKHIDTLSLSKLRKLVRKAEKKADYFHSMRERTAEFVPAKQYFNSLFIRYENLLYILDNKFEERLAEADELANKLKCECRNHNWDSEYVCQNCGNIVRDMHPDNVW